MTESDGPALRCFIGAFLERESAQLLAAHLRLPEGVRRIDRSAWHVTLKFLGATPAASVADLLATVAALQACPIEVEVTGFIGMPRAVHARVVAAEVAADPRLSAWAERLATLLGPEDRQFRPHVTVARSGRPIRFPLQKLAAPVSISLQAPALYRSVLERSGARYRRVLAEEPAGDSRRMVTRESCRRLLRTDHMGDS